MTSSNQMAKTLMVQGTTSDAGKSTLVAGLCRLFANHGVNVAPFKPQNMALNSAVTQDGGEIGRAQALQAHAARVELHTDFNPVLLKPGSDTQCQVIVQGKALTTLEASEFFGKDSQRYKQLAMTAVLDSFSRLKNKHQMVLVEGAGSPAEINLRENDIANMGFAEVADCPVIIIADIDKGGVFAHLVGTLALLSESEQQRVKGFVINRFRGDISLLQSGLDWLEQYTNKPVLGVLPYLHDLHLDAEDAVIEAPQKHKAAKLKVLVLVWPHISNHTDFDPLRLNPSIEFSYHSLHSSGVMQQDDDHDFTFPAADLIILPGSKSVRQDLEFMRQQRWDIGIKRHLRYGGKVMGICGGYQMLGQLIDDPQGVESELKLTQSMDCSSEGLGLLPIVTELTPEKVLTQVSGVLQLECINLHQRKLCRANFSGYEIHCGVSRVLTAQVAPISSEILVSNLSGLAKPITVTQTDGVVSADNQVFGTYMHGLFDSQAASELIFKWAGASELSSIDIDQVREQQLDRLAGVLAESLDMTKLSSILNDSVLTEQ